MEHKNYQLNVWDVGGQKTIRAYWRNYFEKTDGLIWGYNDTCGYCLIQINTRKKDPSLVLEAYDLNGEKLFTHVVKASSLQF